MRLRILLLVALCGMALWPAQKCAAHDITFCGEAIPMNRDFVANKLMEVIRRQIPNVNLPALRQRALANFTYVDGMLRKSGIPVDFKYLPIVESGFTASVNIHSGARGFWQLMPPTARQYGLVVNERLDERDDIIKSTYAAIKELKFIYSFILRTQKIASWVLTAAGYDFGAGNITKAMKTKGKDYFTMDLNKETAVYVYKIIAVKELFEYPELYMKSFGYNVFAANARPTKMGQGAGDQDAMFRSMSVNVSNSRNGALSRPHKETYVAAHIRGKYRDFHDGDVIDVELDENLTMVDGFKKSGGVIKGKGWMIDGRIYVDLNKGHDLMLYDTDARRGLAPEYLKKGTPVLLKNDVYDDGSQWK